MATTIKDIARKLGVSHSTVSRAMHGSTLISPETVERIQQAAQEMGYQPSAAARSLKTNRTRVLGVIVSSIDDPFFSEILSGIEECAQEEGYSLFIASSQHDPMRERKIVQTMMEQRTDGVIICSSSFSAEQGHQLMAYGFPVVVLNNQTADDSFHFSIYHDDVDGSQQITKHLIDLGHRKIAYLGNSRSGRTTQDRLTGFRDAMREAGIAIPDTYIYEVAGGEAQLGNEAMGYFKNLEEMPTAIFCFNDILAMGVLRACSQAGIRVPEQISVAGFDNIIYSAFTNPTLTTFDQPKYFLGMEAAKLLLDLLHYEVGKFPLTQTVKVLKGSLLVRNSTAAPAA
jgi:LacI family transcriptional regulator/LacI family repressor for deo operon, udp, cdd, tsx, nupC, and nupG